MPDEQVDDVASVQRLPDEATAVSPEDAPPETAATAEGAMPVAEATVEERPVEAVAEAAVAAKVEAGDAPAVDAPAVEPPAAVDAPAAVETPATPRRRVPRPIRAVGRGIAAAAPTVIGIGLLVVGLVGGWQIATTRHQNQLAGSTPSQPVVALTPAQDPPVVVSEVISAIGADDGNLLAASLPEGPLMQIQNALTGVAHVRRVIPAGTVEAGDQTVTAIQIIAEDTSGQLFGIDLLIHTDSTGVVGFR